MLNNLIARFLQQHTAPEHAKLGKRGEEKACAYLKQQQYAILERNWKSHPYEIDIICFDKTNKELVFVEVKTRRDSDEARSFEAFTPKKQRSIIKGAKQYIAQKQCWDTPCRFDLICINGDTLNVEHFSNVITEQYSK